MKRPLLLCVALLGVWSAGAIASAATYGMGKGKITRKLAVLRKYEIPVRKGKPTVAAIPALMSFWGSTHRQVVLKSEFVYEVKPDEIKVTADDRGMPRRNYELKWNAPEVETITVTQRLLVELSIGNRLYTVSKLPYAPAVLKRFASSLGNDEKINKDNPRVVAIGKEIMKKAKYSEQAVELVCDWINENITFKMGSPGDSDSVLQGANATCNGMSSLACAMLRSMGIPAERVAAKFIGGTSGHTFIEVYYPDAGWVFYDLSNHERGFKSLDCLMTVGWSYRVGGLKSYEWQDGYFCVEKDVSKYDEKITPTPKPLRAGPKGHECLGTKVIRRKPSAKMKVRHLPLRELLMDVSISPGKREYVKANPLAPAKNEGSAKEKPAGASGREGK